MLAVKASAQGLPPPSLPEGSLDLAPSDLARVVVDKQEVSIQLKAPAAERLRQVTAANVGGKVTLTLDGMLMLRTWVSGEIGSGAIGLQDVKEPLLGRLRSLERQVAAGRSTQK